MDDFDRPNAHLGHVLFGTLIMALSAFFLLDRMNIVGPWVLSVWVPLFLIAFGLTRIVWPTRPGKQIGGVWIALVGGLLLLDQLDIVKFHESWPVFVIMAGLMIIFRALGWLPSRRDWLRERADWKEVGR